ncbi:hypothetical protein KDD93_06845 [Campylobacter sp. faydin G-24]|uniref:Phage tail tape measure protein n=1 Tax=Campylobacter anatolicus TaxID=2829105 RepID=A0ABS5HKR1_9BACT|nr:hypothetical protein [Campylobacter anatolicus]MBR8464277.1 hypothetical protein [Campylobacter anatolicus]
MLLDEFFYKIGFNVDKSKIDSVISTLDTLGAKAAQTIKPLKDGLKEAIPSEVFERNAELIEKLNQKEQEALKWAEGFKQRVNEQAEAMKKSVEQAENLDKNIKKVAGSSEALKSKFEKFKSKFFLISLAVNTLGRLITNYLSAPLENIENLAKQKGRLFDITQAQIAQAKEYHEGLKTTKAHIQSIVTQTALKLLPSVNLSTRSFNNFLSANKDLIVSGLAKVGQWIVKLSQVYINSFRAINYLITSTIGWKNALMVLGGALVWIKRAMIGAFLASPIGLAVAALALFMLLADDLITYLNDGKSLLGKYWEPFIKYGNIAIEWFNKFLDFLGDGLKWLISKLSEIGEFLYSVFTGDWERVKQYFIDLGEMIIIPFEKAFNYIKSLYDEYIAPIVDTVKSFSTDVGQKIKNGAKELLNSGLNLIGLGDDTVAPALALTPPSNSYDNHATTVNNNVVLNTNNPQIADNFLQKNFKDSGLNTAYRNVGGR